LATHIPSPPLYAGVWHAPKAYFLEKLRLRRDQMPAQGGHDNAFYFWAAKYINPKKRFMGLCARLRAVE
jgi:hypothetical protein